MNVQILGLSQELAAIAQHLRQATVQIQGPAGSSGSGVLWNDQGLVVTNAHVVPQRRVWITLANGQQRAAHRVRYSERFDLAALQIKSAPTLAATGLQAVSVGDADALRVGQLVMAVGNPQGDPGAMALGIVHNKPPMPRWVQADIRLAPGYSGGPLATLEGKVIGINTLIAGGRGYAIPVALVKRFLGSQSEQPYLGLSLKPVEREFLETTVAWGVTQVVPGSPAAQAGLVVGDRLLGINGRLFRHPSDLTDWLDCLIPNQTLALELSQGGQRMICTLTVGQLPLQEQAA